MNITKHIAKQLREVYFGGNWSCSNFKDTLENINWQHATLQIYNCNTIATLTFHSTYYVTALLKVLKEGILQAKDEYSFKHPPINNQNDWEQMLLSIFEEAQEAILLIESLHDSILEKEFTNDKYGNYYRNLNGIIEHLHYHLGQIVIVKKIILQTQNADQYFAKQP
jgi:hypothetical protein